MISSNLNRQIGIILLFTIVVFIFFLLGITNGTISFGFKDIMNVLAGYTDQQAAYQVIHNIRLPRVLTAVLVGMNLAVAGALLQGVLRNPLASPQIIGVNSGAGLMAVLLMVVYPGLIHLLPLGAFTGAMLAAFLVYGLAVKDGPSVTSNIVLAGVAISALMTAFTSAIMIINSDELQISYTWLLGSLAGRGWSHFSMLLPYSMAGLLVALYLGPKINLFNLGDEVSKSLGLSVNFYRAAIIVDAALLAGSAVSVAGTIGFVGLIAPHLARLMVGNDYRYLLILSALLGSALLVAADVMARIIFQPVELPVGILTAALGAPFFFYLMYMTRNSIK